MKKATFVIAVLLVSALPAVAQSTSSEFGILFGGTHRIASRTDLPEDAPAIDEDFSLSKSSLDIYYGVEIEPGSMFKVKLGRIEAPVSFKEGTDADPVQVVYTDGKVEHVEGVVEYRFSEAFGSTALFGGAGLYRHSAEGAQSETGYGFNVGVNADFPLSSRYGIKVEGTYHWVSHDYRPRYITLSGGLRIAF
jgi:hypothetical protein